MSSPSPASLFVSRINSPHFAVASENCQRTLVVALRYHPSFQEITASLGEFAVVHPDLERREPPGISQRA
jgi:hypothetical protein